ncbi:alpha/beta fold hydrolase [Pseudonocardia sp. TRM90224]|uniref:alpha/beta fold hydrolase n=1 Tax=Pseudonocardia sp. TRM90224 TaxID=2812678 RepID=UPI001E35E895|nr:alpha/beta hydrolase [Pseudonocardia sp. TRM90224]
MTETLIQINGVELCVDTLGKPGDPTLLLIGTTILSWPHALAARLADGGRRVVRYDLRDTGRSTTVDPDAPGYTLRDLVADAVGVLDALGSPSAHVAGLGVGGWIAQLLALDHADRVASLVLAGTRPTAPGRADRDLPEHDEAVMRFFMTAPKPDWSDRDSVLDHAVAHARVLAGEGPFDEADVREGAAAILDRAGPHPANARNSLAAMSFAALDCKPRWRKRLPSITAPTLVVHGADDPFFPIGNAEALAREIPGARLHVLPGVGAELPRRAHAEIAEAILSHTAL